MKYLAIAIVHTEYIACKWQNLERRQNILI